MSAASRPNSWARVPLGGSLVEAADLLDQPVDVRDQEVPTLRLDALERVRGAEPDHRILGHVAGEELAEAIGVGEDGLHDFHGPSQRVRVATCQHGVKTFGHGTSPVRRQERKSLRGRAGPPRYRLRRSRVPVGSSGRQVWCARGEAARRRFRPAGAPGSGSTIAEWRACVRAGRLKAYWQARHSS